MNYSTDAIYSIVGRDDKVAVLTFKEGTGSFAKYGETLTVVFSYDQFEREKYEKRFAEKVDENIIGKVKARYLGYDLPAEKVEYLKTTGIDSGDIFTIFSSPWPHTNVFHSQEKRSIKTIEVPIKKMPKGKDYDWIYGFHNRLLRDGAEFYPDENDFYIGMKLIYEPEEFTDAEKEYAYKDGKLLESIERHYLDVKFEMEITTPEEEQRWQELTRKFMDRNLETLKQELQDAGSSMQKLYTANPGLFKHLLTGTLKFSPRRLNGFKGRAIYIDWNGYLHVFIRHVSEFLWNPQDVMDVIKLVIENVDDEIQAFWKQFPDQRFSKYGAKSLYFEGDYYTFHIEADGRLSTFHRSKVKV
jgi:hypothetical protein